jgi:hypothetical protein
MVFQRRLHVRIDPSTEKHINLGNANDCGQGSGEVRWRHDPGATVIAELLHGNGTHYQDAHHGSSVQVIEMMEVDQ